MKPQSPLPVEHVIVFAHDTDTAVEAARLFNRNGLMRKMASGTVMLSKPTLRPMAFTVSAGLVARRNECLRIPRFLIYQSNDWENTAWTIPRQSRV
jgi:hypothetical protein